MKKVFLFAIICLFIQTVVHAQCTNCEDSQNNGINSTAIGKGTQATGQVSFVSGGFSIASGDGSTAIGFRNLSSDIYTTTLGSFLQATESHAMVIGDGYGLDSELVNNHAYSLMIGFHSDKPTFFVSTSDGVNATGRIGIGNMTDPQAKLHIFSDDDESATLFLQPFNWTAELNAELWLGDMNHGISAEVDAGMVYNTENYHVFKGGDVFIEEIDKGIIMKSPDGNCWRGVLDNSGNLQFTVLESCPDVMVNLPEETNDETNANLKVYPNPTNDYLTVELTNSNQKEGTVSLLDEKGSVILTKQFRSVTTKVYTGDLPSGIYFVRVNADQEEMVQKVIKQ